AFVDTGRLSAAYDYAASLLTTSGGPAVPNIAIAHPDGTCGALSDLLRGPGAPFLVLCFPGAGPPAVPSAAVRIFGCSGRVGPLPVLRGDGLPALGGEGDVLVIRPDQHLAARLRRPKANAVDDAIAKALGKIGRE